jgi:hypothetical protein
MPIGSIDSTRDPGRGGKIRTRQELELGCHASWMILHTFLLTGKQRLSRAAVLARRMAGAWIAALGALMLALWFSGYGG